MTSQQCPASVVPGVVVVFTVVSSVVLVVSVVSGFSVVVGLGVVGGALLPHPTQMATTGS